jgi:Uma2 family endonuclease
MSTTTLLTFEQFERIAGKLELLNGELIGGPLPELLKGEPERVPFPQRRHIQACKRLFKPLDAGLERFRGASPKEPEGAALGEVFFEMGYMLPGDPPSWLRPDVSITHPDQPGDRYYEGGPLMVFEIVSEYDSAAQLAERVGQFLANGAREVWVIYPETREAWLYDGSGTARRMKSIQSPLLPGLEITLDEILK